MLPDHSDPKGVVLKDPPYKVLIIQKAHAQDSPAL